MTQIKFHYESIWFRNLFLFPMILCLLLCADVFFDSAKNEPIQKEVVIPVVVTMCVYYLAVFLNNHFLLRKLLYKGRYRFFLIAEGVYIWLCAVVNWVIIKQIQTEAPLSSEVVNTFVVLLVGAGLYSFHNWFLENVVKIKKDSVQKSAELEFLKQQLNPHFLINAINNLYGISLSSPDRTSDKILELADLLRYQIEVVKKNEVPLSEEMRFIEAYKNYSVSKTHSLLFKSEAIGTKKDFSVPPLLFLPLTENAIKFSMATNNPFVKIKWIFREGHLIFSITNSRSSNIGKGTEVGLENLKKRLALLDYKTNLKIEDNDANLFKAHLSIWPKNTNA